MPVANCPETPRQKMIGMMYLVLTAMLALNVSNEVLDAFALVNKGLANTNQNFSDKNYGVYSDFENKFLVNENKVGPYWEKAQLVRDRTAQMYEEVQKIKKEIAENADGKDYDLENIRRKDHREASSFMLKKGRANQLKQNIENFRTFLINIISASDTTERASQVKEALLNDLSIKPSFGRDGTKISWESAKFENVPAISSITMMTKLQNDIRNAESDAIIYLYEQIDAKSHKFTNLEGRVLGSDYVLQGTSVSWDIVVAAIDTTQEATVRFSNGAELVARQGVAEYSFVPGSVGSKMLNGTIIYKDPNGKNVEVPFSHTYQVAAPTAVVSPTKMNVFYAGIQNPVEISAAGVPASDLNPGITNGRFVGSGSNLAVIPTAAPGNKCTISLRTKSGKSLGAKEFRIRKIPDPVAMVGSKKGGRIGKNELMAQSGVDAVLENFNFDLRFNVKSFTVSASLGGFVVEERSGSDSFTMDQKNLIRRLKNKQKVYIEDIVAVGPDGTSRRLPAIALRIR